MKKLGSSTLSSLPSFSFDSDRSLCPPPVDDDDDDDDERSVSTLPVYRQSSFQSIVDLDVCLEKRRKDDEMEKER